MLIGPRGRPLRPIRQLGVLDDSSLLGCCSNSLYLRVEPAAGCVSIRPRLDPPLPLIFVPFHPSWQRSWCPRLPIFLAPFPVLVLRYVSIHVLSNPNRIPHALPLLRRLHQRIRTWIRQNPVVPVKRIPEALPKFPLHFSSKQSNGDGSALI